VGPDGLSRENIAFYREQGYLVAPGLFDSEEIAAHGHLSHPAVVGILTGLVSPNVKCMQSMLFVKGPGKAGQSWHQDEYYIPTRDRSLMGAWIAIDDATVENGCLWIIPGSNKPGYMFRRVANATGIEVVHETHRNKWSFAAHVAREYLEKMPDLRITLDASHWVCVAETFLQDQPEAMALAIARTGHIHARVGYPCGPQVPDPRAPEWQEALQYHLGWWDAVIAHRQTQGAATPLTVTPEFGPYPYMVELPYSRQPIVSQWDVNVWMMGLLKERWSKS